MLVSFRSWVNHMLRVPLCWGGGWQVSGSWNLPSDSCLPEDVPSLSLPRAKYAVNAIKKKVNDKNPHVALYALEVMSAQAASTAGPSSQARELPGFYNLSCGAAQRALPCPGSGGAAGWSFPAPGSSTGVL